MNYVVNEVLQMTDQALLSDLAKSDPDWYVRRAAVGRIEE